MACLIRSLSGPPLALPNPDHSALHALEVTLTGPVEDEQALRRGLAELCAGLPLDVSVQRDNIYRRHWRLAGCVPCGLPCGIKHKLTNWVVLWMPLDNPEAQMPNLAASRCSEPSWNLNLLFAIH